MNNNIQTDLFGQTIETPNPIITLEDAELLYHPTFYDIVESDRIFKTLLESIEWKQDKIMMMIKKAKKMKEVMMKMKSS